MNGAGLPTLLIPLGLSFSLPHTHTHTHTHTIPVCCPLCIELVFLAVGEFLYAVRGKSVTGTESAGVCHPSSATLKVGLLSPTLRIGSPGVRLVLYSHLHCLYDHLGVARETGALMGQACVT